MATEYITKSLSFDQEEQAQLNALAAEKSRQAGVTVTPSAMVRFLVNQAWAKAHPDEAAVSAVSVETVETPCGEG